MQYSYICPIEACHLVITIKASDNEDAIDKLTELVKNHLVTKHPDIQKSESEIRNDIISQLTEIDQ